MEIWLDTINVELAAKASRCGIISGITTNPSLLSKSPNVNKTLTGLLKAQPGPVAVQVTGQTAAEMSDEGKHIFDFSDRMIIKVPVSSQGLEAIHLLCSEKIPVLGTGVFYPAQALLAAKLGVKYIAPYYAHINEIGNAYDTLKTIKEMFGSHGYPAKILAASVRTLDDFIKCAHLGIEAVTIKDELYHALVAEPALLEKFNQKFSSEWCNAHGNVSIKYFLQKIPEESYFNQVKE